MLIVVPSVVANPSLDGGLPELGVVPSGGEGLAEGDDRWLRFRGNGPTARFMLKRCLDNNMHPPKAVHMVII